MKKYDTKLWVLEMERYLKKVERRVGRTVYAKLNRYKDNKVKKDKSNVSYRQNYLTNKYE